jgi:hypothetical protein
VAKCFINSAAKGQLLTYFLDYADCQALIIEEALLSRFMEISGSLPRIAKLFVGKNNSPRKEILLEA